MSEGKHREQWDGHTVAIVAAFGGPARTYDELTGAGPGCRRGRDPDDMTTGDDVADWNLAMNLLGGAECSEGKP